jgi:SAM-dependent methyltransferase
MINPERVLVATMADKREPYISEVEYLFRSLSQFGGTLAHARRIAYFTESVDRTVIKRLATMDVIVKIVDPVDVIRPHANKIRLLDDAEDFDYLVALDTDTIIVKDFSAYLSDSYIAAKPADWSPLNRDQWKKLFQSCNVDMPALRYLTCFDMVQVPPYFNTGVLLIPKQHVSTLRKAWMAFILRLDDAYQTLPGIDTFFTDQYAFALGIASAGLSCRDLPLEMNFPTHHDVHSSWRPSELAPYILHHHHRISPDGNLLPCSYPNVNTLISSVNEGLRDSEQGNGGRERPVADLPVTEFDNRRFWDTRYTVNPELGSGIGSRGPNLKYKRGLLRDVVRAHTPTSILDVGCGDIEVVKDLPFDGTYIGIDVAPSIVARNRRLKPGWTFIEGSFPHVANGSSLESDLVICFDVIIHLHDYGSYWEVVSGLVDACKRIGVVSGFETTPREQFASEITAYHEPITTTLRRAGVTNMDIVGQYRGTAVVRFMLP